MKKLFQMLIISVLLLSSTPVISQVETGKIMYEQRNNYWSSFLLVFATSAYTRATTASVDGLSITLALDFVPPDCLPTLQMVILLDEAAPKDNIRYDVVVTTRTDDGTRVNFPASSSVTMGDMAGLVYVLNSDNLMAQIGEMSRGRTLRMKTVFGGDESTAIYNTYSLMGMTAAYRRAQRMCADPASIQR